jgi:serine/threonine protein phosphatase 1
MLFFEGLRPYAVVDGYLFVHAGIREGVKVEDQSESDLLWLREEFYTNSRIRYGKGIVFGHTPFGKAMRRNGKYGIDTGAVFGGPLTCIALPGLRLYQSTC